ncbi:MAG: CRISPR-associated helicase Cas3', partial [Candidatus Ornithospirochaeta sp.]
MVFRNKTKKSDDFNVNLEDCLAKTESIEGKTVKGMTVKEHCVLTGYIARELYQTISFSNNQIPFFTQTDFIASLHDIGKVSKPFQNMIYGTLTDQDNIPSYIAPNINTLSTPCRHDSIGQVFLSEYGESQIQDAWQAISKVVGGHHGIYPGKEVFFAEDNILGGKPYNISREKLLEELEAVFGNELPKSISDEEICFLTGLTTVSDWISSAVSKYELCNQKLDSLAAQKIKDAGYSKLNIKPNLSFEDIFGFKPHKVQKDFYDTVNDIGTYILEVEMGKGKTEAALYASYKLLSKGKASGIYFALPTRLTSLSIHKRMLSFIDKITTNESTTKLVFQNSYLYMNAFGEDCSPGGDWFDERKRGILAPFGVGTIDQALMSVINVKHSSLRAFGLAGKVVIIDELHSYDEYTGSLILYLIKLIRSLGGTVIVLSATLRSETKKNILGQEPQLTSYPLITSSNREGILHEVETPSSKDKKNEIVHGNKRIGIEKAIATSLNGGKVLWISNTVDEAQNVFSIIKSRCQESEIVVGLLHSHFTQKDRKRIEEEFIPYFGKAKARSTKGIILVGTQILEQSLDIDADLMITDIAPIDMLLQRMGRLWRHQENDNNRPCNNPEYIILHPSFEEAAKDIQKAFGVTGVIYAPYVLYRTLKTIHNITTISVPSEI